MLAWLLCAPPFLLSDPRGPDLSICLMDASAAPSLPEYPRDVSSVGNRISTQGFPDSPGCVAGVSLYQLVTSWRLQASDVV